jgi:PadR family transcriptional regulator PadR
MLGEFEYLVLTAAVRLDSSAYGASIRSEIATLTGRVCGLGALYTTLDRLEAKGLIETWMGDATPLRGGRAKRLVQPTKPR